MAEIEDKAPRLPASTVALTERSRAKPPGVSYEHRSAAGIPTTKARYRTSMAAWDP